MSLQVFPRILMLGLICFANLLRSEIFNVSFELGEHATLLSGELVQAVPAGGSAMGPELRVDEGWAFVGWDKSYQNVKNDLTVTAEFTPEDLASILQETQLLPANEFYIGNSVSICGDTAVIATRLDSHYPSLNRGRVSIFTKESGEWVEEAELFPADSELIGEALSLYRDTVVIGGRDCAFVYVRNNGLWTQQAKLAPDEGLLGKGFGTNGISIHGDTIIIGASNEDVDDEWQAGVAYVFVREEGEWTQQAKLHASDADHTDHFGNSVSVFGDTAIVGAESYFLSQGCAYVFARKNGAWSELSKLTASNAERNQRFGSSISLNGNHAIIGAPGMDNNDFDSGVAYVFQLSPVEGWVEKTMLRPENPVGRNHFGSSVSISGDLAIIGASGDSDFELDNGSAHIFRNYEGEWLELAKLIGERPRSGDRFGIGVDISGDQVVISAPGVDRTNSNIDGVAFMYDLGAPPVTVTFDLDGKGSLSEGGELVQIIPAGDPASAPNVDAAVGWRFTGWDVEFSEVYEDIVVTAWYVETYTVTFDLGERGELISGDLIQTVDFRAAAVAPEFSTADGWEFSGWDTRFSSVASDLVVTAEYSPSVRIGNLLNVKALAANGGAYEYFGQSVSIDGDTALVAAPLHGNSGISSGGVYVFNRINNQWIETGQLIQNDPAEGDGFGSSVSLHGDYAVVGARGDDDDGESGGSAYVYMRNGGIWEFMAKLKADDASAGDYFGASVDLSGNKLVVGAYGDDDMGLNSGSAYIFTLANGAWAQEAKLTPDVGSDYASFGFSVSIDGATVAVGAHQNGNVYLYTRDSSIWTQQTKLYDEGLSYDAYFGQAVCLSHDTLIVGAPGDRVGYIPDAPPGIGTDYQGGSAYVFTRSGEVWVQEQKLTALDGQANDAFGWSVSCYDDLALIGTSGRDFAYVFERRGGVWAEGPELSSETFFEGFGVAVSLDQDSVVVGAPYANDNGYSSGAAYFYDLNIDPFTVTFDLGGKGTRIGGGELVQEVPANYGAKVPLMQADDGWRFLGWDTEFSMVTGDLLVTAGYMKTYTVTFDLGEHGTLTKGDSIQIIDSGKSVIMPELISQSGWSFIGWDQELHKVQQDIIVRAQYVPTVLSGHLQSALVVPEDDRGEKYTARFSVDICGDTAVIGDWVAGDVGQVFVYVRQSGVWLEQARLTPSDGVSGDNFGRDVAVSGDTVVVTSGRETSSNVSGRVYVYERNNGEWFEQAKINSIERSLDVTWASEVDISGNTVVVSSKEKENTGSFISRRTYIMLNVYVRNGSNWDLQGRFERLGTDEQNMSICGDTIVVGSTSDYDTVAPNSGAAYVFYRENEVWSLEAKLKASDARRDDNFGVSVCVSGDFIIVGSDQDSHSGINDAGSAYIFAREDRIWTEQRKIIPPTDFGYRVGFGSTVSISGGVAIVGGMNKSSVNGSSNDPNREGAFVYHHDSGNWSEYAQIHDLDESVAFGSSVVISGDTALIIGRKRDGVWNNYTYYDVAHIYDLGVAPVEVTFDLGGKAVRRAGGEVVQQLVAGHPAIWPLLDVDSAWHFEGWDVDLSHIATDITATARYVETRRVDFDLGERGDLIAGDLVQHIAIGRTAIAPHLKVEDGWTFTGWSSTFNDVTVDRVIAAQFQPTEDSSIVRDAVLPGSSQYSASQISVCGDTLLIADSTDTYDGKHSAGSVSVFVKELGDWVFQTKLVPFDAKREHQFGSSVSLSGGVAVIGATGDDSLGHESGSLYIFVRENGVWTEQSKLTISDGAEDDRLGKIVQADDNTLVAVVDGDSNYVDGEWIQRVARAYVFVYDSGRWFEEAVLIPDGENNIYNFGQSVSISGNTIVIGAPSSAYIYARENGIWSLQKKLESLSSGTTDYFGESVDICGDTVVVGASEGKVNGHIAGSVYIYNRIGEDWVLDVKLTSSLTTENLWFGKRVALSGSVLSIRALVSNEYGSYNGGIYIFERDESGLWVEKALLVPNDEQLTNAFGLGLDISGDIFAATDYNSTTLGSRGAVLVYDIGELASFSINFDLGGQAVHSGGGELSQYLSTYGAFSEPILTANEGWVHVGWTPGIPYVFTEDFSAVAVYTPSQTYELWSAELFSNETPEHMMSPGYDYDGDGVTNLDEYLLLTNPLVEDSFVPRVDFRSDGTDAASGKMSIEFNARSLDPSVQYLIKSSEDLIDWEETEIVYRAGKWHIADDNLSIESAKEVSDGIWQLTVVDGGPSVSQLFMRVLAERP